MHTPFTVTGNLVDVWQQKIYTATITIANGIIQNIEAVENDDSLPFIMPGFIDSHVHIESSMLIPQEFAKLAVVHGTVATISDPHEIANVCGIEGVDFMIKDAAKVPFKFFFGAPSCVPATVFETAGAALNSDEVNALLQLPEIKYLSEMMNFPGVLNGDEEVLKKIAFAKQAGKPVDGHAPGLRGTAAKQYIDAGISTDHECFTAEEAVEKLSYGMKILIREGSAARNFEALADLLNEYSENMMFCSDDKHPDSLAEGHINQLCARAVAKKIDLFKVLQAACVNPVLHYKLPVGLLRKNDAADFILVNDIRDFTVLETYIDGVKVAEGGTSLIHTKHTEPINQFECELVTAEQLQTPVAHYILSNGKLPVIEALDGQLITNKLLLKPLVEAENVISDPENDILKMVVVNRYKPAPIAKCFVQNFGMKTGAIASSVAHDSHNIIAVGVDDESLAMAINEIIEHKGGVSCIIANNKMILPLPVAGLMSTEDGYKVARKYTEISEMAKNAGSRLHAPFMTLSFMALLVIPHLKLSDKGLFDGDTFTFIQTIE